MKRIMYTLIFLVLALYTFSQGYDVKIVSVNFDNPKPKTEVNSAQNWYTNHFSVSGSYKIVVELNCYVPNNTAFNVRTYAFVNNQYISLGDARVGKATSGGVVFVSYYIFPSSAKYYGQCQFVVIADADNEINESDESTASNQYTFNATIHRPGESF